MKVLLDEAGADHRVGKRLVDHRAVARTQFLE